MPGGAEEGDDAEVPMLGLVTEDCHAENRSGCAAEKGEPEQDRFLDAPFAVARLPLVNAVEEKGNDADHGIGNQTIGNWAHEDAPLDVMPQLYHIFADLSILFCATC